MSPISAPALERLDTWVKSSFPFTLLKKVEQQCFVKVAEVHYYYVIITITIIIAHKD